MVNRHRRRGKSRVLAVKDKDAEDEKKSSREKVLAQRGDHLFPLNYFYSTNTLTPVIIYVLFTKISSGLNKSNSTEVAKVSYIYIFWTSAKQM